MPFFCSGLPWPQILHLPFKKMLAFVFLPAISGNSHCSVLVPLTNTVLLLGAPTLPTWWVKISTYLHLELFLSITFMLLIVNRIYYYYYYYYYYAIIPMS
jgi:hypothetical protein